jgi:hypothetical protein
MRIVRFIIAAFFITALVVSCGSNEPAPEVVAEKYFMYLNNQEYDKAKELCTEQTRELLEQFDFFGEMNAANKPEKVNIENIRSFIDGDKAVCTYTADGEEGEMTLVKIDGKWYIDINIEN